MPGSAGEVNAGFGHHSHLLRSHIVRALIPIICLLVLLAPRTFAEDKPEPGKAEVIRVICWRNTEIGAFSWFVFKEDYTPLFFFAQSPDGKTEASDWSTKEKQVPMHINLELSPVSITGETTHHGCSISITHEGKKVRPGDITTIFADAGNGSFVASLIATNITVVPQNITEARGMTIDEMKKRIAERQYQCELFQTIPAKPRGEAIRP